MKFNVQKLTTDYKHSKFNYGRLGPAWTIRHHTYKNELGEYTCCTVAYHINKRFAIKFKLSDSDGDWAERNAFGGLYRLIHQAVRYGRRYATSIYMEPSDSIKSGFVGTSYGKFVLMSSLEQGENHPKRVPESDSDWETEVLKWMYH